ncbi:MAG TPA: alpha/beta hydrolase [Phycisphaerales bacterium]|nr:alpha/beta hydrolase [Phycisphaerales bacterium]
MRKKKPAIRRRLIRLACFPLIAYFLYGCALMSFQDRLVFPRDVPGPRNAAAPLPAHWEQLTITAEDGSVVPAWLHMPFRRSKGGAAPAVMFFHGNAEVIDDIADTPEVEMYSTLGVAVMLVEYRGYGRATGAPSEKAIAADSVRFYDALAGHSGIDPKRIIFYGRSLGGGAACALARERKPFALIMQSCFLSLDAMAAKMWVPGFLLRNHFRNDEVVASLDCPILFMHGRNDTIVPCVNTERLVRLAKHGRAVYQACDHNDFPRDLEGYERDVEGFLRECGMVE